jgi:MraZ protein
MSFSGEYLHTVDEKGRVIMPLKFREALGNRCMLTKGMEACLFVYPMEEWHKKAAQLGTLSEFQMVNRKFKRRFFSGSFEAEPDKQGRINLSSELIAYAKLGKDVYITGVGDYIEIWDREQWDTYRDRLNEEYEALAEGLGL